MASNSRQLDIENPKERTFEDSIYQKAALNDDHKDFSVESLMTLFSPAYALNSEESTSTISTTASPVKVSQKDQKAPERVYKDLETKLRSSLELYKTKRSMASRDVLNYGKLVESSSRTHLKAISLIITVALFAILGLVFVAVEEELSTSLSIALCTAILLDFLYFYFRSPQRVHIAPISFQPLLASFVALLCIFCLGMIHFSVHAPLRDQLNDWVSDPSVKCEWKYDQMTVPANDDVCLVSDTCVPSEEGQEASSSCGCKPNPATKKYDSYYFVSVYEVQYAGKTFTGVGCKSDLGKNNFFMTGRQRDQVFEYTSRNGFVNPPDWHCSSPIVGDNRCLIRFDGKVEENSTGRFETPTSGSPYVEVIASSDEVYWNKSGSQLMISLFFPLAFMVLFFTVSYYLDFTLVGPIEKHIAYWDFVRDHWYDFTPKPKICALRYAFLLKYTKGNWLHRISPAIRNEIKDYF